MELIAKNLIAERCAILMYYELQSEGEFLSHPNYLELIPLIDSFVKTTGCRKDLDHRSSSFMIDLHLCSDFVFNYCCSRLKWGKFKVRNTLCK